MKAWLAILLLLLTACSHPEGESTRRSEPFTEISRQAGLHFIHSNGAAGQYYLPEIMGSGCALFDYDSDGDLDMYLVQGSNRGSAVAQGGNRLFRNELVPSGNLRFMDVTEESGAGAQGYGMGVAVGDYDNDGHPDLYVTNLGPNVLLHNEGNGRFTARPGADDNRWSASASFFDYDRDGALDLFVTNYVDFSAAGNRQCHAVTGELDYCTPRAYRFVTDSLFRNRGNRTFEDVSSASRVGLLTGPGLGAATTDVNRDGWPDILVANDSAANFLWVNQRDGTFDEQALQFGVAYAEDGIPKAGMGVTPGDFDNDGDEDVLVVNLMREGATLFRQEDGYFADVSLIHRLNTATLAYTGFGTGWLDFDSDGRLDLFITNGAVTTIPEQRGKRPHPFEQRSLLLRNTGAEKPFENVTAFEEPLIGRGAAFGDIDNDGDIDVLVTNNGGPAALYRNDAVSGRHWLMIQLTGTRSNRMGLGAMVGVIRRGAPPLWRRVRTDSSYLSASDSRIHFGLGDASDTERVQVHWPSGITEEWLGLPADKIAVLTEGSGRPL